ncbi:hypothetical protein JHK85_004732 [Glycine max]|nr:hypothetical protein JHK85_004732 [Glycine max]
MLKKMKKQPLLFVELLFWKTRRECHYINAEYLLSELGHLKKESVNWNNTQGDEEIGSSPAKEELTAFAALASLIGFANNCFTMLAIDHFPKGWIQHTSCKKIRFRDQGPNLLMVGKWKWGRALEEVLIISDRKLKKGS